MNKQNNNEHEIGGNDMAEKPHMNIVFIGHVDHGKSTLVGRLLLETGHIDQHIIDKYRKEAEEHGKAGFEFAYVMDGLKEERERGVTIDVAHKRFDTDKYYFTIIDAPGHRDFVKNMITGTSQADAAVLVVAAPEGIMAQTKEHLWLSKVLGVDQIIIALNKMDATKPEYSEEKYNETKAEVEKMLKMVGYRDEQVQIIPVSALRGKNINKSDSELSFHKGATLVQALDNLKQPQGAEGLPLRMAVQDVYNITGIGAVPVGRIECGTMKAGDKIIFVPSTKVGGATGEVKSIEMHHETVPLAHPGDNVGINVRGVGKKDIRRGDVAGPVDNPPTVAKKFKAQIMVLNHPSVITNGYTPVFHCHTTQVACTFEKIVAQLNPRTGAVEKENPDFIKSGQAAIVEIRPTRPMVIEEQKDFKQLSRFAIRDMGQTVAAGICIKVLEKA
jgi:elongation factor 1-alpha